MARTVVIGAGVAGLSCARALVDAGREVVVLDKGRGVGGRCATRRIDGFPVDHGLAFLHGDDPDFLAALARVPATRLDGWPRVIRGGGTACAPAAFAGDTRCAFAEGSSAFPKHLAAGLDVRTQARVTALTPTDGALRVTTEDGAFEAGDVVVALPVEQAIPLAADPWGHGVRAALRLLSSRACLTAIVGCDAPDPGFELCLPGDGIVQLVSHESSKRPTGASRVFVVQATPTWSRLRLEEEPAAWLPDLLAAAAASAGLPELARPTWTQTHRWRYARIGQGFGLSGPVVTAPGVGLRVGWCGEAFDPQGGVEGAWRSGRRLAAMLAR